MDRRYSPITDLYGTAPQDKTPRRRSRAGLYLLMGLAGFFIFQSIQPVMRLRPDPPPSVVGARLNDNASRDQYQLQMARACWEYAVDSVQNLYPYGSYLPKAPPKAARSRNLRPTALSELCWPRLRNAWTQSASWKRSYQWSTDWMANPDSSFRQIVNKVLDALGITL